MVEKVNYQKRRYHMDSGVILSSLEMVAKYAKVPRGTMVRRMAVHGATSELVFFDGYLTKNAIEEKRQFSRSFCKRDSILCKNYTKCQNSRLGLSGAGPWIEPDNTDLCYKKSSEIRHKYSGPLEGCRLSI